MKRVILHIEGVVVRGMLVNDLRAFEVGLLSELPHAFEEIDGESFLHGDAQVQGRQRKAFMPRSAGSKEAGRRVARGIAGALRR